MPLPKIAVLTSIIVTNKNYIYQGGVVVLFDEKRTKNRDLRRGGSFFLTKKEPKTVTRRERVVYITNKIQKIKASIHSFIHSLTLIWIGGFYHTEKC